MGDHPFDDQLAILTGLQSGGLEGFIDPEDLLRLEDGLYGAGVLAIPDQIPVCPASQNQLQGSYDDGFSSTGFPCDANQARTEFPG